MSVITLPHKDGKIIVGHDEIRHLVDIIHYADHPDRIETAAFRTAKEDFHRRIAAKEIAPCFIDNGFCDGHTEIHHMYVEYSAGTAVDWALVQAIVPITDPDMMPNFQPLCHKHHMGAATGIHMVTYPAWLLQKFLNKANIILFEAAVKHLKETRYPKHEDKTHDDHKMLNTQATAIIQHLAAQQAA
jgi:hypothetical protein